MPLLPQRLTPWRIAWLIVLVLAVAAGAYAVWRYVQYAQVKAVQLVQSGETAQAEGRLSDALNDFDGALAFRGVAAGPAAQAAAHAAEIFSNKGQTTQARDYLKRAHRLQSGDPTYAALYARALLQERSLEEADELLQDALERTPDNADLLVAQSRLLLARQDADGAREAAARAVEADAEHAEAVLLDAALRIHTAPAAAADAFKKVQSLTKDERLVGLAGELRSAAQQIDAGLDNVAFEHVLVGAILLAAGEFDAARLECSQALEADQTYRDALAYRGAAELAVGEVDAAAASLERAKELDPTYGYTRFLLGQVAQVRSDVAAADAAYLQALELGYDEVDVYLALAGLRKRDGKLTESREALEDGLTVWPTDLALHESLFWLVFSDLDDTDAAADVAATFVESTPNQPLALGLVALAEFSDSRDEQARTAAEDAIRLGPNVAVAHLVLGLLDDDDAELTRAIDLDSEGHVSALAAEAL